MTARLTPAQVREIEDAYKSGVGEYHAANAIARLIASHREVEKEYRAYLQAGGRLQELEYLKQQADQPSLAAKQAYINGLECEIPHLAAQVETLQAEATRLRSVVQSTQWKTDQSSWIRYCPWCTSQEDEGHKPDCFVGKALTGQEAKVSGNDQPTDGSSLR